MDGSFEGVIDKEMDGSFEGVIDKVMDGSFDAILEGKTDGLTVVLGFAVGVFDGGIVGQSPHEYGQLSFFVEQYVLRLFALPLSQLQDTSIIVLDFSSSTMNL